MALTSPWFLVFLAAVTVATTVCVARLRWLVLVVASYAFYALLTPRFVLLLAAATALGWFAGNRIHALRDREGGSKRVLVAAIVVLLVPLAILKYTDFAIDAGVAFLRIFAEQPEPRHLQLALPVGISFYTFQIIGYLVDVDREMCEPEPHFGRFAAFVAFFPHVTAGPIARSTLLEQLAEPPGFDESRVVDGLRQAGWGAFKKLVVADRLGVAVDTVYAAPEHHSGLAIAAVVVLYAFQVYADFSGYSDIAIGSARVLGVELGKNFAQPYHSTSVSEYWRRWHISFSTWLNDYVYMSLAARLRAWRVAGSVVALLLTFAISGLWHGAGFTFVVFGLAHGIVLVSELLGKKARTRAEKRSPRLVKVVGWACTFSFLCLVDVLFRAPTLRVAGVVYRRLVEGLMEDVGLLAARPSIGILKSRLAGLGFTSLELGIAIASVVVLVVVDLLHERKPMRERLASMSAAPRWTLYYAVAIAVVFFGSHTRSASFVYYQF